MQTLAWHEYLFRLSYEALDGAPDRAADRTGYWIVVLGMAVYVAIGSVIFLSLNAATLIFGVYVTPVWQANARWVFLRLPNGLPVIPFSVAILLIYTSYRTFQLKGPVAAFGGWALVAGLAVTLVLLFAAYNWARAKLK